LFPNIKDWAAFVKRVELVCAHILKAISLEYPSVHLLSVDEKTSIQALERVSADQPMEKGKPRRLECEYIRHGTTCLMAAVDVGKGKVVNCRLHPTRNEEDFLIFIKQTVSLYPEGDEVIFMADQLNIHKSESLVRWIAEEINFKADLGTKRYKGVLENMKTRKDFLESSNHRVRFIFTPKHCSWLNPIENWFGKLQRHVVKYGNFSSIEELENKIKNYINFYNLCLVKPLKWKFKGFLKAQKLKHLNCD